MPAHAATRLGARGRRRGYTVVSASDGRGALELLRTFRPDVILLDMLMPVLDGLGFLTERAQRLITSAIVVAARESASWTEIVRKPYSVATVVDAVERVRAAQIDRS